MEVGMLSEDMHAEGACYRCNKQCSPLRSFVLYLDPDPEAREPRALVCDDCLSNEANVVRVSPFAFRVAPRRDLTRED
jgi:hypothetical protein